MPSERRLRPRVRVMLPGRADGGAGDRDGEPVEVLDLSGEGAQIACGYLAASRLIPRGRSMVDAVGFSLRLSIGYDGAAPAAMTCAMDAVVQYSRRVAQDEYRFGLRFVDLSAEAATAVRDCVDRLLAADSDQGT